MREVVGPAVSGAPPSDPPPDHYQSLKLLALERAFAGGRLRWEVGGGGHRCPQQW